MKMLETNWHLDYIQKIVKHTPLIHTKHIHVEQSEIYNTDRILKTCDKLDLRKHKFVMKFFQNQTSASSQLWQQ
jgi:hypothetical protein